MNLRQAATAFLLSVLIVAKALAAVSTSEPAGSTTPGTVIKNRAELSYIDNQTGETVTTYSNEALITVARLFRFTLYEGQTAHAQKNSLINLTHVLSNTGNIPDGYDLSLINSGGTIDLLDLTVHQDLNGNGNVDVDEPAIDRTPLVQPGETVELVVSALVPANITVNATAELQLTASSAYGTLIAQSNVDIVEVSTGVSIELRKSNLPSCETPLFPGEIVSYSINYSNGGDTLPAMSKFTVDGVQRTGVLLHDDIPSNTILDKTSQPQHSAAGAIPVVSLGDSSEWLSFRQWNGLEAVRSIGLLLPATALQPQLQGFFHFDVKTNSEITAETRIENTAWIDLGSDGTVDSVSNTVCNTFAVAAGASPARLRFVEPVLSLRQQSIAPVFERNSDFTDTTLYRIDQSERDYQLLRDGVYLELQSSSLNRSGILDDGANENAVIVDLKSKNTDDSLRVMMLESGPNTGTFRSTRVIRLSSTESGNGALCPGGSTRSLAAEYEVISDQCVLKSLTGDQLHASFFDSRAGLALEDFAVVDPFGITFDSESLEPVANTLVKIIDADTSQVLSDPLSGESLELMSNEQGQYELPRLIAGTRFYLDVTPPSGFVFPSVVPGTQLGSFRVGPYSYGESGFAGETGVLTVSQNGPVMVGGGDPILSIDIPLDPAPGDAELLIEKKAMLSEVAPGEFVGFEVSLRNISEEEYSNVKVTDILPFGYKYVEGSSSLSGLSIEDPSGGTGPELVFDIGAVEPDAQLKLIYVLQATAGALDSSGINRAYATAEDATGVVVVSPESAARVTIRQEGVLSDRASIFGKVYIDADCNLLQNDGEWPIGGVKLYLEDGSFVITDEDGLYSLYGLSPGNHVIKVDPLSLPDHVELKPLDNSNAADPDSRFVDLLSGDFHRADFAAGCPASHVKEVFEELRERRKSVRGDWLLTEADQFEPGGENPGRLIDSRSIEADGDISHGVIGGSGSARKQRPQDDASTDESQRRKLPATLTLSARPEKERMPLAKKVVSTITQTQAKMGTWLWPRDDISKDGRFMAVIRSGITPQLFVNGQPVPQAKIGEQIVNKSERAQIVAWYGVRLKSGINQLEIRGVDPFGNTRVMASKTYKRPATGARLVLRAKKYTLPADGGRSVLPIEINILDDNDYPALGVYFVNLENSDGQWVEADIQDREPGHQVKVENGRALVHYRSSEYTGNVDLRVTSGVMMSQLRLVQVASARPLLGVGVLEVGKTWSNNDLQELDNGARAGEIASGAEARLAFFLKGKIKGDMQLTLSYDSAKSNESNLLRDINPNAGYAVHGDASLRGFEAQSRSKLYAKLERGKNSVMWGDYLTDSASVVEDLGRVQRTLTGLNGVYDNGQTRVQSFAARASELRRTEEIPANGTAMLFRLQGAPIVPNSEVIELVTRDADNPGLVLATTRLSRLGDYVIDALSGQIKFARSIPTFDESLGRNYVRISYDEEKGGAEYTVAGVRLNQRLTENVSVGVSHTLDDNPLSGSRISSAWYEYNPGVRTRVAAGVGLMQHEDGSSSGSAQRISIEHSWNRKKDRHSTLSYARAERGFNNPGAGISADREEVRLSHRQSLNNTSRLEVEASHSASLSDSQERNSASAIVEKSFNSYTARVGMRRLSEQDASSQESYTSALIGVDKNFRIKGRNATLGTEYEHSVGGKKRQRFRLDSSIELADHLKGYARYDVQNGIEQFFASSQQKNESLTAGLESDFLPSTRVYSEYRARGINGEDELENGSGIRGSYQPTEGLLVSPALEAINVIKGDDSAEAVAVSVSISDQRNKNARSSFHGEVRYSEDADYVGLRASHAARLNKDWSGLVREDYTRLTPSEGEITSRHSFITALSRRPKLDNRHHMLFMYNWKQDYAPGEGGDTSTHILSTHQNLEINKDWELSGRLGAKWQKAQLATGSVSSNALLFDTRLKWEFNRRFDFDLRGGWLSTDNGRGNRFSVGVGASFLLNRNLRVGMAYNIGGFREEDLDTQSYNVRGLHAGLQYKFDEDLFHWLEPSKPE